MRIGKKSLTNLKFEDVNMNEYPEFENAKICSACHEDGTPLTDAELDRLNDDKDYVYEKLMEHLYGTRATA